jgi:integrase
MQESGSSAGTAHHAHRTIRVALGEAKRRGHVATNVAEIAKAPRLEEEDIEPFTIEEVQSLLVEAAELRNSTRWVVALALGLRQGEALGLHWEDVDLDAGYVPIRKNRLRPKYAHGCADTPCGRKAGYCPRKQQTRREHKSTKSRAGRRTIGLPDPLIKLLRQHQEQQDEERIEAGADGRTRDTSSPPRPAAPSARTPTSTPGSDYCEMRAYETAVSMTLATPPRPSS